jgi:hypothetical protein
MMRYYARITYAYADGSLESSEIIEDNDQATLYARVVGTIEALTHCIGTITNLTIIDRHAVATKEGA